MIITQNQPGVAHLVISRTDKKNALTRDMYRALSEGVSKAAADASVHAIVLSGDGGVFTAGNDLDDFRARATDENPKPSAALAFIEALMDCDTPIIAAVEGLAIGIGTTLLLHCDSVIAGRSARFKTAFVDLGLVPEAASTVTMPLHLGSRRTADLLLMGDTLDGEEARECGLVSHVVDDGLAVDEALAQAGALAA
ncbi:MAG: enoyl-CoA hydratase-related protein, partial [Marinobacter sp.]